MDLKILLIHPPWLRFFDNGLSSPPLALNGIASYIKRELPQQVIDVYNADHITPLPSVFYNYFYTVRHEDYVRRLRDLNDPVWREVRGVIADFNPDVLGIGSMTASYVSAVTVSRIAKQINPNMIVVLGGKHPSALPEDTLRNRSVDFVVIGEGEETFKELLLNLKRPEIVPGIAYRNSEGKVLMTPSRAYINDINTLPFPVFESSINRYPFEQEQAPKSFAWGMISARGCPFQCIYCASDKTIRYRSPENVAEEIMTVKGKYGINYFDFEDDSFSLNRSRTISLCNYLRNQNVKWTCITRVDLIDESLVSVMKESGCISVSIGIETGSPKSLEIIEKKISYEKILDAIQIFRKYGILCRGYFMIGFPWEDREDMEQTLALIRRLPIDSLQLNIATPLPGTQLLQSLVDAGKMNIPNVDWSRYHQGSPDMNFSSSSDVEWREMISDFVYQAFKIEKRRILKKTARMFLLDPFFVIEKIKRRLLSKK